MHGEIGLLLTLIDEGFDRHSWHGTNLRGSIRGLTPGEVVWRPGRGRHNIWELVVHAAYWKYTVRRRLLGEKRGTFVYTGSNFFPRPDAATGVTWEDDVALLIDEHRAMREAVAGLPSSRLYTKAAGSKVTNDYLIRGIAAHDLYHAGQIQLLKRLQRS